MMDNFTDHLQQLVASDSSFAEEFEIATAELQLAVALTDLRAARGWSQRELAKRAGMTPATLNRLERAGRTPTVVTLWRWARALDATIELHPDFTAKVVERKDDSRFRNGAQTRGQRPSNVVNSV